MNTIREASIEDSPINKFELNNNSDKFFDYYAREFSNQQLDHNKTKNKTNSDSDLHFLNQDLIPIKSKSNLSLQVSNLPDNISQKTSSSKSISPLNNQISHEFSSIESNSAKSVTPIQGRKSSTLKQRIRRFNSSLENRIFNLIQTNDSINLNISHKNSFYKSANNNNKSRIKNQEITDEANQSLPKIDKYAKIGKDSCPELWNLKRMNNAQNYSSLLQIESGTNKSEINFLADGKYKKTMSSSTNSIDTKDSDEVDILKKAFYQKPIAKDALKTSIKNLAKETNEPKTTKKVTISNNSNDKSNVTTTTTITTTKTVLKLDELDKKKSLSKRRNTISSITLINNTKSNTNQPLNDNMVQNTTEKKVNKIQASEITEISESNIFDIIEREDIEFLKKKLVVSPESINCINEYDFTPLDLALMLNNKEIIELLLKNGAIENPTLSDWNDRYERVCARLCQLDTSLRNFLQNFDVSALNHEKIEEYDLMLKNLDSKMRIIRRMKNFFESTPYPREVRQVFLDVQSQTSLMVRFQEPEKNDNSFLIKYLVEWSSSSSFEPLEGQIVLSFIETNDKQFLIENLVTFKVYYVRVSCANIRGYGPYSLSDPPFGIPSYWRDGQMIQNIHFSQIKKLFELDNEINSSKLNLEFVNPNLLNQLQKFSKSKKSSGLKRNLKTIFTLALATTSLTSVSNSNINVNNMKFAKQIKKCSAYLVCIIYDDDKIVTTLDDNLPMIEIDENYSSQNINSDFQFLIKLSFNWNDIDNFKNQIEQSISTSSLRFRYLTICVIKQMQNLLELSDLGRVYFNYFKNSENGSVFFVLVKKMPSSINQNLVKANQIDKLIDKIKVNVGKDKANGPNNFGANANNFHKNNEDTNFLLEFLKSIIEYDLNCEKKLSKGFYVAFLKLKSSIELIKVMVPFKIPNNLPCEKVRDNPNISREEWNLLKSVKLNLDQLSINELNCINFIRQVLEAIYRLFKKFDINEEDIQNSRLITRELIEINEDLTLLLICPSVEQTCTMQLSDDGSKSLLSKMPNYFEYIHLPVQLFEAVHLGAYNLDFIKTYVKISIKLELEFFASNQFYREAFSNDEIDLAKKILSLVSKYQRSLEDIWKQSRWIINCINNARDKANQQSQSSIRFPDLKNFMEKVQENNQKNVCCNCHFDYNNNIDRKNIYNHITQLPQLVKCNCEKRKEKLKNILTTIGFKTNSFNHIDSIQIDDEDINHVINGGLKDNFVENFGSIEDLTGKKCQLCDDCIKNCTNCQKNKSIDSLNSFNYYQNPFNKVIVNETSSKTVNKLVSKLYISAPTTPSTPKNLSTDDLSGSKTSVDYKFLNPKLTQNSFTSSACSVYSNPTNQAIKESLIESPLSTSSSSGYYSSKNDSNLSSPSTGNKTDQWQSLGMSNCKANIKKLNVLVDFETGLKIDLNFECTINGKTKCKDLIFHMIKKINSFINSFNLINKGVDGEPLENEETFVNLASGVDLRANRIQSSNGKDINCIYTLDENTDLYYLVICLGNNFSNEKILADDWVLSNLKEPWLNGVFYLRSKDNSKNLSKKNLQQF